MPQKGRLRPPEARRPTPSSPAGTRGSGISSPLSRPLFPHAPGGPPKAREEADNRRLGEERAGPGRQPEKPRARAGQGGSAPGSRALHGWQGSPRHAHTVKAGQGEVGGGSLGFYLRCNSLAEDCS